MPKLAVPISVIQLDFKSQVPLYLQIYQSLRKAILTHQLVPGFKLPSSRELASSLSVSRNTVVNAVSQLVVEGYLETRPQSGTFVRHILPESLLDAGIAQLGKTIPTPSGSLSKRGKRLVDIPISVMQPPFEHRAFSHGMPALDQFPFALWGKFVAEQCRYAPQFVFEDNPRHGFGHTELRQAVAEYLGASRAVRCTPDQILIVNGSQQALYLAAQMLVDSGDPVWIEEPSYIGARAALSSAGTRLVPIPVGPEGLDLDEGIKQAPKAKCAYVTPSHQFPLGVTMSVEIRLRLLDWAHRHGMWIIEDDYDSEYRYSGRPVPSLQGMDQNGCVIYIGTFSKVMFSGLRLGYMVVPHHLVEAFQTVRAQIDLQSPGVAQAALARFMSEGHFARHIRRMRTLYAQRRELLSQAVKEELGDDLTLTPSQAGMHVVGRLPEGVSDIEVANAAKAHDVQVTSLSKHYVGPDAQYGLVMGFAAVTPEHIRAGIQRLRRAMDQVL
jgi:GntR family transcriptional regulator/MocR family aminotransferase